MKLAFCLLCLSVATAGEDLNGLYIRKASRNVSIIVPMFIMKDPTINYQPLLSLKVEKEKKSGRMTRYSTLSRIALGKDARTPPMQVSSFRHLKEAWFQVWRVLVAWWLGSLAAWWFGGGAWQQKSKEEYVLECRSKDTSCVAIIDT